ncbi:MAG: dTMP kinase [Pseudorhodobacter sp.]
MAGGGPHGSGRFFSFEGIDGSGKSTQARFLQAALAKRGVEAILTREPGGSPGAEEIRNLLLEGGADRWSPRTEILLFTAARRDHLERTILPALHRGAVVITDRFADSTRAYQGLARNGGEDLRTLVDNLHDLMIGMEPDLTFLIDLPPEKGLARATARGAGEQRFEEMGLDLQQRLRAEFLDLARATPERFALFDGAREEGDLAADILAHALDVLT